MTPGPHSVISLEVGYLIPRCVEYYFPEVGNFIPRCMEYYSPEVGHLIRRCREYYSPEVGNLIPRCRKILLRDLAVGISTRAVSPRGTFKVVQSRFYLSLPPSQSTLLISYSAVIHEVFT